MKDYFKPNGFYRWSYLRGIPSNITTFFRWMKWCWQRAFRGYADSDAWGVCYYLSEIIPPMIQRLRLPSYTCPCDTTPEEWDAILAKIEHGLGVVAKRMLDLDYKTEQGESIIPQWEADKVVFNEAMDLLKEYYFGLWD